MCRIVRNTIRFLCPFLPVNPVNMKSLRVSDNVFSNGTTIVQITLVNEDETDSQ